MITADELRNEFEDMIGPPPYDSENPLLFLPIPIFDYALWLESRLIALSENGEKAIAEEREAHHIVMAQFHTTREKELREAWDAGCEFQDEFDGLEIPDNWGPNSMDEEYDAGFAAFLQSQKEKK